MNHRLALFVTALLAPTAACIGGGDPPPATGDTGTPPLDDVACLYVETGGTCPDEATASAELVGDQTCEDPVRQIVATGGFIESYEVGNTGYGYYPAATGDTGVDARSLACCYEAAYIVPDPGAGCTIGRPLTFQGVPVRVQAMERDDWCDDRTPSLDGLTVAERRSLAEAWLRDALMEHASVPAFARVAHELSALGAPATLVSEAIAAMADEVRHARAAFALASTYAGTALGPSPLDAPERPLPSLAELAVETFREGCVGESLAVGRAALQLRDTTDPVVRQVLAEIVEDEGRHAELAWSILRWALAAGGPEVRVALQAEVEALGGVALDEAVPTAATRAHGIADASELGPRLEQLLDEVVRPIATELLAA